MPHQYIKQPDGNWAIWSTVSDSLVAHDITAEQLIEIEATAAAETVRSDVRKVLKAIENGETYWKADVTWTEAKKTLRRKVR